MVIKYINHIHFLNHINKILLASRGKHFYHVALYLHIAEKKSSQLLQMFLTDFINSEYSLAVAKYIPHALQLSDSSNSFSDDLERLSSPGVGIFCCI